MAMSLITNAVVATRIHCTALCFACSAVTAVKSLTVLHHSEVLIFLFLGITEPILVRILKINNFKYNLMPRTNVLTTSFTRIKMPEDKLCVLSL